MSNQVIKRTLAFFLNLVVFTVIGSSAAARGVEHWVSVDAAELDVVALSLSSFDNKQSLNTNVARIVDGIAILKLDDSQMEDLSRGMHESFHKCGGFVEHSSEADAVAWIERMTTAEQFVPSVIYSIDNQTAVNSLFSAAREVDT